METLRGVNACMRRMDAANEALPAQIKAAIDEKAVESGQVTAQFVMDKLEAHSKAVSRALGDTVKQNIAAVLRDFDITTKYSQTAGEEGDGTATATTNIDTAGVKFGRYHEYRYRESVRNGRLFNWAVPEDFDFPPAKLHSAWFAYLVGWPNNRLFARDENTGELVKDADGKCVMMIAPIRPLRDLSDDLLPRGNQKSTRLKKKFRDDWRPVLKVMHSANRAAIANTAVALMDSNFVQKTFTVGLAQLKLKHPEIFEGTGAARCHFWSIATWNTYLKAAQRKNK